MPDGFKVGAAPRHTGPVDPGARSAAAKQAGAQRAKDEEKQRALVGEALPPEEPAPPPVDPTVAIKGSLQTGFGMLFGILGSVVDPKWNLAPAELDALASAWAPIAVLYLPSAETVGPWGLALVTTGAVVGPRLLAPDQQEAKPEPVPTTVAGTPPAKAA